LETFTTSHMLLRTPTAKQLTLEIVGHVTAQWVKKTPKSSYYTKE
jgi:hypothetical protein